jgi:hypothetical protein
MNAPPSSDIASQLLATALFAIPVVIGTGCPRKPSRRPALAIPAA